MNRSVRIATYSFLAALITADARSQETLRASIDSSGAEGNAGSGRPWISADGRFVTFASGASNLVPGDTNAADDIFVHDLITGVTTRVSVDFTGAEANFHSYWPQVSADGRHVVFLSSATNLIPQDANGYALDVFVHDCVTGETDLVSKDSSGTQGDGSSQDYAISAEGHYVAFSSFAGNLVPGDANGSCDVFLHDRYTGATIRVSVSSVGAEANANSYGVSMNADAGCIAFKSHASNLVANDANGVADVFVHEPASGSTHRVSLAFTGADANGESGGPFVSADGRYVAFDSAAKNIVPGDSTFWDVFVHDRWTGRTERVSVSSTGAPANYACGFPSLSADGRLVAFVAEATNLVPDDSNHSLADVFLRDRLAGTTTLVTTNSVGEQSNDWSFGGSMSADGRFIGFSSLGTNLVTGDTNGSNDAFVRRCSATGTKYCAANPNSTGRPAELEVACAGNGAEGDLSVAVIGVPDGIGWMVHGANRVQIPFGDGYRCTGGDVARGAVTQSFQYRVVYTYDDADPKHSLSAYVATTRNFQYWFRDVHAGGSFNTSDASSTLVFR